jgi:hypothetical protein
MKQTLVNTGIHLLIQYIHQLLRHEAFDDFVLRILIDSETITLLEYIFAPTETAWRSRIVGHWTVDWDVAIILEALEELYLLQIEHKHLEFGSRCQQVIDKFINKVPIQSDNMEKVRRDTFHDHRPYSSQHE